MPPAVEQAPAPDVDQQPGHDQRRADHLQAAETFAQSSLAALGVLFMQTLDELSYIFEELAEFTSSPLRLYCDNAATVLISQDATSAKRVPYIMRRVGGEHSREEN